MKLPSCVVRTLEFEFGNYTQEQLDRRIKECCEGDANLCDEFATCYYLMHGLAAANLEIGLRWLHDRTERCVVCRVSVEQSELKLVGMPGVERQKSLWLPWVESSICFDCLKEAAAIHRAWVED